MSINQVSFDTVSQIFENAVFVIPTFQRPYAWDEKQFNDLCSDIRYTATTTNKVHYLSPIHVIPIQSNKQTEWLHYTDTDNKHINEIHDSNFEDECEFQQRIYLVVDGQQRLTTIFMLLFIMLGKNRLTFTTKSGVIVPRLILNPASDHYNLCKLFNITAPIISTSSKSQARISLVHSLASSAIKTLTDLEKDILRNSLKTILIELDADYGLRGFLTLNDRGKLLTNFEKLKSLFMEFDLSFGEPDSNPRNIHIIFGKCYESIDSTFITLKGKSDSLFTDDELLRHLSIDIFLVNSVLSENTESIFDRYRKSKPNAEDLHSNWLAKLNKLSTQISDLTDRLNQSVTCLPTTSYDPLIGRSVYDHYKVIFDSLSLSPRSIAFALKFRSMFNIDWHEKKFIVQIDNDPIIDLLFTELRDLLGAIDTTGSELTAAERNLLKEQASNFDGQLNDMKGKQDRQMSILDLAEWIELFIVQMYRNRDYIAPWKTAFATENDDANKAFGVWSWFCLSFNGRRSFFANLFSESIGERRKITFHLLAEYESMLRSKCPGSDLPHKENLDVEHFLPNNSIAAIPLWPWGGFVDPNEYFRYCNTLGNLLLLDAPLNRALQDQAPHIKLDAYKTGSYAETTATVKTQESIDFVSKIPPSSSLKFALRLRRIELLIFAIKRF